jgi:outer membrane lipoprotein carrier protein
MIKLLFALLAFVPQQQLGADGLVRRVSETYGRMKDFSAEFEQFTYEPSNRTGHQRGLVYLKSAKKARFEYQAPEKKTEVSDGKTFTQYWPEIKQAQQLPISKVDGGVGAVLQIVGNRAAPWKDEFREYREGEDKPLRPGNRVVRMIPKNNKDLREVRVEIDPKTFWIYNLAFTYASGDRNEFRFSNIQTSTSLDESLFKFVPPPGVDVVKE